MALTTPQDLINKLDQVLGPSRDKVYLDPRNFLNRLETHARLFKSLAERRASIGGKRIIRSRKGSAPPGYRLFPRIRSGHD